MYFSEKKLMAITSSIDPLEKPRPPTPLTHPSMPDPEIILDPDPLDPDGGGDADQPVTIDEKDSTEQPKNGGDTPMAVHGGGDSKSDSNTNVDGAGDGANDEPMDSTGKQIQIVHNHIKIDISGTHRNTTLNKSFAHFVDVHHSNQYIYIP